MPETKLARYFKHTPLSMVIVIGVAFLSACAPGGTLEITGPDSAEVRATVLDFARPCCREDQGCISDVDVVLSPSGFASISPVVDGVRWQVVGRRVLCAGVGSVPCHGTGRVSCLGPADGFAFGTLTIVGGPVYCIKVWDPQINGFQTICNNTSINVEIDGTWAGTWALRGDTGSSMALKLANAINNHSVLKTKVVAAASGNEVLVRARTAGVDFTYPWYTTCSFNTEYFTQCAFEAKRSPNATLGM